MAVPAAAAQATKATTAASSVAKGANLASGIEAGGQVAALAISTIAQVSDANKRRRFEQNLAFLNMDQQKALDSELRNANNASERLKIIAEYLTVLNTQRINNLVSRYSDDEKRKRTTLIIAAAGLGLAAILIVYVITKK